MDRLIRGVLAVSLGIWLFAAATKCVEAAVKPLQEEIRKLSEDTEQGDHQYRELRLRMARELLERIVSAQWEGR